MERIPVKQEEEDPPKFEWHRGIFNHLNFGMTEEEVRERSRGLRFDKDWQERPLAINRGSDGSITIASVPSGEGIDIIWGMKFELTLYSDGRYCISTVASWVGEVKHPRKKEGQPRMGLKDGCRLHPSCLECPEKDCVMY